MRTATAETEARETAEANGWFVSTRYSEGIADVSYRRGERSISAEFGPSGRVTDITVLDSRKITQFIPRNDRHKRAQLFALLRQHPAAATTRKPC